MTDGRDAVRARFEAAEDLPPLPGEGRSEFPAIIEVTEDGVARAFIAWRGAEVRFDHEDGRWYLWQKDHWAPDRVRCAYQWCRLLSRSASEEKAGNELKNTRKAAFAGGVEKLARSDEAVAVTRDFWDGDPMLMGCPGATLDLRDGKTRLPDPADGITKRAGVAPDDGPCPAWHRFLLEVTGGDEDVVHFLQVWCGYLLTGETIEHVLLFLFGPGGNGKSVFLNVVARVLGDYAVTASMDTFTAARGERHPADLAMLDGARLVSASETEEGRAWAESRIKAITGGDPVTARFMRGDFFTYRPAFKLMIVGNHQPVLRNVDQAVRRRFLILPLTRQPSHPDLELEAKLWAEAPQILAWMVRGCLEWQAEGLPRPQAIQEATEQYFADQDVFGEWLAAHCTLGGTGDHAASAALFGSWKTFAEAAGERPGTQKRFGSQLRRLGLTSANARIDEKVVKAWYGIRLKNGESPDV